MPAQAGIFHYKVFAIRRLVKLSIEFLPYKSATQRCLIVAIS